MEPSPSTGIEGGSNAAVLWSMVRCFMEWGLTPYATCVIMGVILSYAILNKGAPFKTSSCLVPIFGDEVVNSRMADAFDAISAFALTGAVAGGLGYGAMQLSSAVDAFAGIAPSMPIYVGIIAVMFVCYNASAMSGLRNGITWLSNRNTQLFFLLLLFVFLAGPTAYICNPVSYTHLDVYKRQTWSRTRPPTTWAVWTSIYIRTTRRTRKPAFSPTTTRRSF